MKKIISLLLTLALLCAPAAFAKDMTVTYDFENIIEVDTQNTGGITLENGFHSSIWLGKLSVCCTLGFPVSFKAENISLEDYGSASFGLMCAYADEESKLEIKSVTESGKEYVTEIPFTSTAMEYYTVKLPETEEKIVGFEIFVNSLNDDNSMFDVELEFLKFHKGRSVMLLSTQKAWALHDSEIIVPDSPAVIKDGSTLTPARFVAERFGADVEWIASERKVVITDEDTTIELVIDSATALVNGEEKQLTKPACIIDGRTYTPARFVAENLGCTVGWDAQTKTVFVDR